MARLKNQQLKKNIIVGIDASSIQIGGGVTHLLEILNNFNPNGFSIKSIIVWSNDKVLSVLPNKDWLIKKHSKHLNSGLINRTVWQIFLLGHSLKKTNCDILFCLGGIAFTRFRPVVQINQNLLPFEWGELVKYKFQSQFVRLLILRILFLFSFRRANGIIFLSKYSRNKVLKRLKPYKGTFSIIPHGVSKKFDIPAKSQKPISDYNFQNPYEIIYVSSIDIYKNQINLIKSLDLIRKKYQNIILKLIGFQYPSYFKKLDKIKNKLDPSSEWIFYEGIVNYDDLFKFYNSADMAIYPSRCESFGLTLLEKMSASLPVCCSNVGTLPEIIKNGGLLFDPNDINHMAFQIEKFMLSTDLRTKMIKKSKTVASKYSWEKCSNDTFKYILKTSKEI